MAKITKAEYDQLIQMNDENTVLFCLTLQTGNSKGTGQTKDLCFHVDTDVETEIKRMIGSGINLLESAAVMPSDKAGAFRAQWKGLVSNG